MTLFPNPISWSLGVAVGQSIQSTGCEKTSSISFIFETEYCHWKSSDDGDRTLNDPIGFALEMIF